MADEPPLRSVQQEILYEGLDLHARVLRLMPGALALLLAGMAIMLWPQVPPARFAAWAGLCMAVEVGRCIYAARVRRRLADADLKRVHRCMLLWAVLSGSCMGLAGPLFHALLPVEDQILVSVTVIASLAASMAVSIATRYIIGVYALAVLVPLCINWGLMYRHQIPSLAVFVLLYAGLLVAIADQCERLLGRSVSIRRERDRVVDDLERSNTEVRAAVARAEREAVARTRMLAAASHDLRQPLHALSIYSAVLAANPAPQTLREVGVHFNQILRSLGALLHGLLDLSQLSSGPYTAIRRSFAADKMLASVCVEFELLAVEKGLVLDVDLEPVTLVGDAMAISRVARNLIDNALKYTERGTVGVRLQRDGAWALLTVTDTGKGIVEEQHARVFEEFFQVENPGRHREQGGGLGLGLAIVQRLVDLIDARITLHSQLGHGTRFEVRIPGVVDAVPAAGLSPLRPTAPRLVNRRAYVVDGDDRTLRSTTAQLMRWGFDVDVAHDADEAVALFARLGRPDLLIADLRLGDGEHGVTLARRMRALHGDFAVLIATGDSAPEALRQAHQAGWKLLHKPVEPEAMRSAIDELLDGRVLIGA